MKKQKTTKNKEITTKEIMKRIKDIETKQSEIIHRLDEGDKNWKGDLDFISKEYSSNMNLNFSTLQESLSQLRENFSKHKHANNEVMIKYEDG